MMRFRFSGAVIPANAGISYNKSGLPLGIPGQARDDEY
jgi:hypothetical protein